MTSGNGNGGIERRGARSGDGPGAAARDPWRADRRRHRRSRGKLAEDALGDGIDHVMVLSLVAGRREEEGRLDEALALLRRARAAAPDAAGILNQVGLVPAPAWSGGRRRGGVRRGAGAWIPRFAPALANRATALMALGRLGGRGRDFEAAAALDPGNLVAAERAGGAGAAARRRRRRRGGWPGRCWPASPAFPGAVVTLAGAELADGRAGQAEAGAAAAARRPAGSAPIDRAIAWGLLGDALDAQRRFAEAFARLARSERAAGAALQGRLWRAAGRRSAWSRS